MFPRTIAPNWRNNERAFADRADARGRIFRRQPFCGPLVPTRIDCLCGSGALPRGCNRESASVQLFMALCFCIFLHPLRWLLFLDDRPSCHRCRVVGGGTTPVGKSGGIAGGPGTSFRTNSSPPSPSLFLDGHSARARSFARFETRLSQLEFLSRARGFVFRLFYFRIALSAPAFRATRQGPKSALHDLDAQGCVYQPADVCALSYLWCVRLADEPELSLVLNHVLRLHLRGRGRQFDVPA